MYTKLGFKNEIRITAIEILTLGHFSPSLWINKIILFDIDIWNANSNDKDTILHTVESSWQRTISLERYCFLIIILQSWPQSCNGINIKYTKVTKMRVRDGGWKDGSSRPLTGILLKIAKSNKSTNQRADWRFSHISDSIFN